MPSSMKKIVPEDIPYIARLYGLTIKERDMDEVFYRLSALLDEAEKIEKLDLMQVEPIPLFLPKGEFR